MGIVIPPGVTLIGGAADDLLIGRTGHDSLEGGRGRDILRGGSGNDTLVGGEDNDELYGGIGDDVYIFGANSGRDAILDDGGSDTIRINALSSQVTFAADAARTFLGVLVNGSSFYIRDYFNTSAYGGHIEKFVFSDGTEWTLADVLNAVSSNPEPEPKPQDPNPAPASGLLLEGTEGDDNLIGGEGDDTLDGAAGNDRLEGDWGDDTYHWGRGSGHDLIADTAGQDKVLINANTADVSLSVGTDGACLFISMGDKDSLMIMGYFDTAEGVGHIEKLVFADGTEWDINKVLEVLADPKGRVIVGGKGRDVLTGTAKNDTLDGAAGHDILNGGAGNDILIGGQGQDVLTGGVGNDIFVFARKTDVGTGSPRDTIVDFWSGDDRIDLRQLDANILTRQDNNFSVLLKGHQKFTKAGQLRYDAKTGILSGNTDNDAAAEFQIFLKNKPKALSLADFIL